MDGPLLVSVQFTIFSSHHIPVPPPLPSEPFSPSSLDPLLASTHWSLLHNPFSQPAFSFPRCVLIEMCRMGLVIGPSIFPASGFCFFPFFDGCFEVLFPFCSSPMIIRKFKAQFLVLPAHSSRPVCSNLCVMSFCRRHLIFSFLGLTVHPFSLFLAGALPSCPQEAIASNHIDGTPFEGSPLPRQFLYTEALDRFVFFLKNPHIFPTVTVVRMPSTSRSPLSQFVLRCVRSHLLLGFCFWNPCSLPIMSCSSCTPVSLKLLVSVFFLLPHVLFFVPNPLLCYCLICWLSIFFLLETRFSWVCHQAPSKYTPCPQIFAASFVLRLLHLKIHDVKGVTVPQTWLTLGTVVP